MEALKSPPEADSGRWMKDHAPKKLNHRHMVILEKALSGQTQAQIVKDLGMDQSRVSVVMRSDIFQLELARRQKQRAETLDEQFKRLAYDAADTIEQILKDPNAPLAVRLNAATYITDRVLGKPGAAQEQPKINIRDLYAALDRLR